MPRLEIDIPRFSFKEFGFGFYVTRAFNRAGGYKGYWVTIHCGPLSWGFDIDFDKQEESDG